MCSRRPASRTHALAPILRLATSAPGIQEIRFLMIVRGFPKFNQRGRRNSLWDVVNEESPTSLARRNRGPIRQLMLAVAGDPSKESSMWNGKLLELVVILCIVLNTLILAVQHPSNTYPQEVNDVMNVLDVVLTCIFTLEMVVKIFAYGMYRGTP